jgi:peptidoglycan/LPS O-acetylase OafA/YrhL
MLSSPQQRDQQDSAMAQHSDRIQTASPSTPHHQLTPPLGAPQERLVGLQVLRGIAVLLVIFHHYVGTSVERGFAIDGLAHAAIGNAGADMFFIVSGFIMEYTHGGLRYMPGDRGRFLLCRAIRILPMYWVLTLTAYLIATQLPALVNSTTSIRQLAFSMVLLPDVSAGAYVLPMAWTLSFEMVFYLLFALLLPLRSATRLVLFALVFAPAVFVPDAVSEGRPALGILLNPILFEFTAGVALAMFVAHGKSLGLLVRCGLVGLACGLLLLELNLNLTDSMQRLLYWGGPSLLLVAGFVLAPRSLHAVQPGALVRCGQWLGDISYSLYLSHFFTIGLFSKIYMHYLINLRLPPVLSGLALFAACIAIGQLCYLALEAPSRSLLNQYFSGRRSRPQAA